MYQTKYTKVTYINIYAFIFNISTGNYCVRSGELLGRTHFFKTSIQFRLIPAVMADRVNTASRVWRTNEEM